VSLRGDAAEGWNCWCLRAMICGGGETPRAARS